MDHGAQQALYDFEPQHEFFVGIDSDGCVFNSMEVKHNDCFSVNLVKHFGWHLFRGRFIRYGIL